MGPVIKGNHQLSFGQAFADLEDTPARLMFQQAFGKTMPKIVIVYCTKTSSNHSHLRPRNWLYKIFFEIYGSAHWQFLRVRLLHRRRRLAWRSRFCSNDNCSKHQNPVASVKLNLGSHLLFRIFPIAERTPAVAKPCSKRWLSHRW